MASLTGASIASSYTSLLKLSGNTDSLVAGNNSNAIQVVDGDGTASNLYLNTDRIGIGGQPTNALSVTGAVDITSAQSGTEGNLKLASNNASSSGISFFNTGASASASRKWSINTNYSAEGTFEIRRNTSQTGSINTVVLKLDSNSRISLSNNDSGTDNTVFGFLAGNSLGSGHDRNVLIGDYAGTNVQAVSNVMIGRAAGDAITSGGHNIVIGDSALGTATTATENIAIGSDAMSAVQAGQAISGVVAIGKDALKGGASTTTGVDNSVAIGKNSLKVVTTGANNVAIGHLALTANQTGSYNTAVGNTSLDACTGGQNAAFGWASGGAIIGGTNNVCLGTNAGNNITTGNQNTCVGDTAVTSAVGSANQTVVGYGATGQADNAVTLGNASVTRVYMSQDGDAEMYANGTINTSDKRLKQDIKNTDLGLDFINNLRPVSYKLKKDKQVNKIKYGIIAQEVQEVLKKTNNQNFAGITNKGDFLGADYVQFIAPLMKAVQELSAKVTELESKLK